MKDIPIRVVTEKRSSEQAQTSIAQQWLEDSARTASAGDLEAHMALISKSVAVHGVPGQERVDYENWRRQCEHEFSEGLIQMVSYQGFKLVATNQNQIMFKTVEAIETREGETSENGIEVIIEQEQDGVWRVIQERIMSDEEVRHDRILEA